MLGHFFADNLSDFRKRARHCPRNCLIHFLPYLCVTLAQITKD